MTLGEILKIKGKEIKDIEKIYSGKDRWCRCGCGGNYFYQDNEEDKTGFKRSINKMNKVDFPSFNVEGSKESSICDYVNIPYGDPEDNKCYCVYFKEVKA